MSYRTHCDWCGEHLAYEDDQAIMPVTIFHRRGKGALDAKYAEQTGVTRHFCAVTREEGDGEGSVPVDRSASCYERAIAAVRGTKLSDPGLGMEWRMMPVDAGAPPAVVAATEPPAALAPAAEGGETVLLCGTQVSRELHDVVCARLPARRRSVLPDAGIVSLDQVATMTDADLLAIDGLGPGILRHLRAAICDRACNDGLALARQVYELLQAGLPTLDADDPIHAMLVGALPSLAAVLGEGQALSGD